MRNGKTVSHSVRRKTTRKPQFSKATHQKIAKYAFQKNIKPELEDQDVSDIRFSKKAYVEAHKYIDDCMTYAARQLCDHVTFNGRQTVMTEDIKHVFPEIFGNILDVSSQYKKRKNADVGPINIIQRNNLKNIRDLKNRKKRKRSPESSELSSNHTESVAY